MCWDKMTFIYIHLHCNDIRGIIINDPNDLGTM